MMGIFIKFQNSWSFKLPSQKPRLNLTLPDSLNDVISELADLQGIPKTRIITDILLEIEPMLKQMSEALKAVKENKQDAVKIARDYAQNALLESNEKLGVFAQEVKKL